MAHMHDQYFLTMLKTPKGYLTKTGFTNDINSTDIVIVGSSEFHDGIWSTMLTRLKCFLEKTSLSEEDAKELHNCLSECETITYKCQHRLYCGSCIYKTDCEFWNGDRKELHFSSLYGG